LKTPIALASFTTSVKLYETSKGYMYSGSAIPEPEPGCPPAKIWLNANEWIEAPSGEVTNIVLVDTNMQPVGWMYDANMIIVQAAGGGGSVVYDIVVDGDAQPSFDFDGTDLEIDLD